VAIMKVANPDKVLDLASVPKFVEKSQNIRRILMALKVISGKKDDEYIFYSIEYNMHSARFTDN
jgi:hypothetical protein